MWKERLGRLFALAWDYLTDIQFAELIEARLPLQALSAELRFLGWVGVSLILFSMLLTTWLYFYGGTLPAIHLPEENMAAPLVSLYLALFFYACGWAFLLLGGIHSNLETFILITIYFTYHGGVIGLGLGSKWLYALVPLAAFSLLFLRDFRSLSRREAVLLLLFCLGLTSLLVFLTPLKRPFPLAGRWALAVGLGIAVYALLRAKNRFFLHSDSERRFLSPYMAGFAVAAGAILFFFWLAMLETPGLEEAAGNALTSFNGVMGVVSIFWFILGVDLVGAAFNLAEWTMKAGRALLPLWALAAFVIFTSAVEIFLGRFALKDVTLVIFSWRWTLPFEWAEILDLHSYISLAILGITLLLLGLRALNAGRLLALFGFSVLTFLLLRGYYSNLVSFLEEEQKVGLGTLFLYVAGFSWQLFSGGKEMVRRGSRLFPRPARLLLLLGLILTIGAISHFEIVARYSLFAYSANLEPFYGATYLGLPYLLYLLLYRQSRYTPVPRGSLLALYVFGAAAALPVLILERLSPSSVSYRASLLLLVQGSLQLLILGRMRPWDEVLDGVICAGAVGLGFATFYSHPIYLPLPWVDLLIGANWQKIYWPGPERDWFELGYIYLGHLAAAVLLGYHLGRAKVSPPEAEASGYKLEGPAGLNRPEKRFVPLTAGERLPSLSRTIYHPAISALRWPLQGLLLALVFLVLYERLYESVRGLPLSFPFAFSFLALPFALVLLSLYLAVRAARGKELAAISLPSRWTIAGLAGLVLTLYAVAIFSSGGLLERYEDPRGRFAFSYPRGWEKMEMANGVFLFSQTGEASVEISVLNLSRPMSAEELAALNQSKLAKAMKGYRFLSAGRCRAGGQEGWCATYLSAAQEELDFETRTLYLIKGRLGYSLSVWVIANIFSDPELLTRRIWDTFQATGESRFELLTYADEESGFHLTYPSDWHLKEQEGWLLALGKSFEIGEATVGLTAEAAPAESSINIYVYISKGILRRALEGYRELDESKTTIDDRPAIRLTFSWQATDTQGEKIALRTTAYYFLHEGSAYSFFLGVPEEAYEAALPDFEAILKSLRFTGH
ncbi:MAG: hypothetical protein ACUVV0_06475 [Anaerolineae bacterium]